MNKTISSLRTGIVAGKASIAVAFLYLTLVALMVRWGAYALTGKALAVSIIIPMLLAATGAGLNALLRRALRGGLRGYSDEQLKSWLNVVVALNIMAIMLIAAMVAIPVIIF